MLKSQSQFSRTVDNGVDNTDTRTGKIMIQETGELIGSLLLGKAKNVCISGFRYGLLEC